MPGKPCVKLFVKLMLTIVFVCFFVPQEWIKSRDDGEDSSSLAPNGADNTGDFSNTGNKVPEADPTQQYVVVSDTSPTRTVCPICQEELKYQWHEETEEFVFMDAKQVGPRIYHASCHAEASKDKAAGTPRSRAGTPDVGVAGIKRKADVSTFPDVLDHHLPCIGIRRWTNVALGYRYQPED